MLELREVERHRRRTGGRAGAIAYNRREIPIDVRDVRGGRDDGQLPPSAANEGRGHVADHDGATHDAVRGHQRLDRELQRLEVVVGVGDLDEAGPVEVR